MSIAGSRPVGAAGPRPIATSRTQLRGRGAAESAEQHQFGRFEALVDRLRARSESTHCAESLAATPEGQPPAYLEFPSSVPPRAVCRSFRSKPCWPEARTSSVRTSKLPPLPFRHLHETPPQWRHAGLLALGDPVYRRSRPVQRSRSSTRPRPAGERDHSRLQRRRRHSLSQGMSCYRTTAQFF